MSEPKYFVVQQEDDVVILLPMGSIGGLDATSVYDEWDAILDQFDAADDKHVVIDLGSLDYFGSIMLQLLIVLWKRLSKRRRRLALCNVSQVGMEILQAAKLDTIWPIVSDRSLAIQVVKS